MADARTDLTRVIREVTDAWDEPLDEVHDVPQIVNAVLAYLALSPFFRDVETGEPCHRRGALLGAVMAAIYGEER